MSYLTARLRNCVMAWCIYIEVLNAISRAVSCIEIPPAPAEPIEQRQLEQTFGDQNSLFIIWTTVDAFSENIYFSGCYLFCCCWILRFELLLYLFHRSLKHTAQHVRHHCIVPYLSLSPFYSCEMPIWSVSLRRCRQRFRSAGHRSGCMQHHSDSLHSPLYRRHIRHLCVLVSYDIANKLRKFFRHPVLERRHSAHDNVADISQPSVHFVPEARSTRSPNKRHGISAWSVHKADGHKGWNESVAPTIRPPNKARNCPELRVDRLHLDLYGSVIAVVPKPCTV